MDATFADGGIRVQVADYASRAHLQAHRDTQSRISLVLAGGFSEEAGNTTAIFAPGDILLKSNAVAHENRFGEGGAKIFSVAFGDSEIAFLSGARFDGMWRRARGAHFLRLGTALIEAAQAKDECGLRAAVADLLSGEDETSAPVPPPWLRRLKDEIETNSLKDIDLAARAVAAGIHPAHLSRLFRRCFAVSVTEHAQFHNVRRAIGLFADERASLSAIALGAGFYDQSHMNRVFRRVLDRTPAQCRRLFTEASAA